VVLPRTSTSRIRSRGDRDGAPADARREAPARGRGGCDAAVTVAPAGAAPACVPPGGYACLAKPGGARSRAACPPRPGSEGELGSRHTREAGAGTCAGAQRNGSTRSTWVAAPLGWALGAPWDFGAHAAKTRLDLRRRSAPPLRAASARCKQRCPGHAPSPQEWVRCMRALAGCSRADARRLREFRACCRLQVPALRDCGRGGCCAQEAAVPQPKSAADLVKSAPKAADGEKREAHGRSAHIYTPTTLD